MNFYSVKQWWIKRVKQCIFGLCTKRKGVIIDVTGVKLVPGNNGRDCYGNGEHRDMFGNIIECCCDECDYLLCCTEDKISYICITCDNNECPRSCKN